MTPEQERRIGDLFEQSVDLPPAERPGFLARACPDDDEIRREVEALLAVDARVEACAGTPAEPAAEVRRVGPYRLVHKLGAGGMSEVFLGVRDDGELERRVAVKLIRRDLLTAEGVRRFETERQILASLDHPAIARLLDAGRTADGVPYFVMEHIEGEPIDRHCDRHRLPLADRLRLFQQVCLAVHFAHQNLVVHRDIKPGNILVTGQGKLKLLDFGIAKLLNPDLMRRGGEPTVGWMQPLTPEYASPEQLLGKPITTASDIYALGVLLFKLLAGVLPHRTHGAVPADDPSHGAEPEAPSAFVRRLLRDPPDADAAGELASLRGTQPRALLRALAGNLDAIVAKALRQEPQNRYASAEQMSEDVGRHLAGGPVAALGGWAPLSGRHFRSSRRFLGVGVLCVLPLVVLAGGLVRQSARLAEARGVLERERARLAEARGALERERASLAEARGAQERERARAGALTASVLRLIREIGQEPEPAASHLLERAAERFRQDLADQPEMQADLAMAVGQADFESGRLEHAAISFQAALATRRRLFAGDPEKVAQSLTALARVETRQGDFGTAERLAREALAFRRKAPARNALAVAQSQVELGRVLLADGHASFAEPFLQEALVARQGLLGDDDVAVAEVMADLGEAVGQLGSPSAAEYLFRKAIRIRQRASANESWELALNLVDRAAALFEMGRGKEGRNLLQEVARIEHRLCTGSPALAGLAAAALEESRSATPTADLGTVPPQACRLPALSLSHLSSLLRGLGMALAERGDAAKARPLLKRAGEISRREAPEPGASEAGPGSSGLSEAGECVPDGAFGEALGRPCCSGVIARGTTVCRNPADWGNSWRTCRHVCASKLVNGCVPAGGITDTLELTDCCSNSAVTESYKCLNPLAQDPSLRTCVQTCN